MLSAEFIDGAAGKILVVKHLPSAQPRCAIVVIPAFGEEMNKSRRLVWETARALSERGYSVLVPDLFGTGDSEGEFENATWELWLEDLRCVYNYARTQGSGRLRILAVRAGSLLLAGSRSGADLELDRVLLWQPVYRGSEVIRQMLRTRIMALRMAGQRADSLDDMRASLLSGDRHELLGGYAVTSRLAESLNAAAFDISGLSFGVSKGLILELGSKIASAEQAESGTESENGSAWDFDTASGERFWIAAEPGKNDDLVSKSVRFLSQ